MRVPALMCLCLSVGCDAGCDPTSLELLHAELALAPAEADVVAWVGHDVTASFTVANTGRVPLEIAAATIDGIELAGLLDALDVDAALDRALLPPGASAHVDVVVRATAPTNAGLLLRIVTLDREVKTALLHIDARSPPPCEPSGPCETAAFDAVGGACRRGARPDGEACDDGSACTDADRCSAATCVGRALTCVDNVGCTVDACDPSSGCVFQPVNETCADGNPCTDDICDPALTGAGCRSSTSPDGTLCGPFSCAELSTCILGSCFTAPTPDGFPCEDGDLCTQGDTCTAQQCEPGDDVDPSVAPPVALARPMVHVEPDVRWYQEAQAVRNTLDASFDVTPGFDVVLDIAQGIVGFAPTLAVLWRTTPFDVHGQPCAPWDMWMARAIDPAEPSFCSSAVVVTFVDEGELAQATGAVGDSVVLDVVYGTASAAFGTRPVVSADELHVVIVESTYVPAPDAARVLHIDRVTLSFASRAVLERATERLHSGLQSALERNVHAGVRVAADEDEAIVAWDLPQPDVWCADCDSDGLVYDDTVHARLDVAALALPPAYELSSVTWVPMLEDVCIDIPLPVEELPWHDVDAARANGVTYVVVRHDPLDGEPSCSEFFSQPTLVTGLIVGSDGSVAATPLGSALSVSLGHGAGVLARIVELPFTCAHDECTACAIDDCGPAPYALEILPTPFDQDDPEVTWRSTAIGVSDLMPSRVASLGLDAGVFGAVVAQRGLYSGLLQLRLVDDIGPGPGSPAIILGTEEFAAPNAALRALRSPLSPQRVYAVTTAWAADLSITEGVVVRFGCAFPTPP